MEPKQEEEIKREEIYSCKYCHIPISSSLSVETTKNNYMEFLNTINEDINLKLYKRIFIYVGNNIDDFCKKLTYAIDSKKNKIKCRKNDHVIGVIKVSDDIALGARVTVGYLNIKDIEITEVGLRKKKEIPVYSQQQYTVLAKLKQLRYYVKQLTPTLKQSIQLIGEEQNNIFSLEDKFEKYKLNLVINRYEEMQKEQNQNEEKNKNKDNKKKKNV